MGAQEAYRERGRVHYSPEGRVGTQVVYFIEAGKTGLDLHVPAMFTSEPSLRPGPPLELLSAKCNLLYFDVEFCNLITILSDVGGW